MKKLLVSIKDAKAASWSVPYATDNKATALREFGALVQDGRTLVGTHPADFDMFQVGFFDTVTGVVIQGEPPLHLANGLDFVKKEG